MTKTADFDHVTVEAVEAALPAFVGTIDQIPPAFSALKKDGKRLHELARKGEEVEIPARQVEVHRLALLGTTELPNFGLDVECGGGTYVRSLVRDIGHRLDTVATMTSLVRTKQGPFYLADCLAKDDWNADRIFEAIAENKNA